MRFPALNAIIKVPVKDRKDVMPKIVCADGATISVQASHGHYCSPRDDVGPWTAVEVAYPSRVPSDAMLASMDGSANSPTKAVYGWVPVRLVRQYIKDHGGEKRRSDA